MAIKSNVLCIITAVLYIGTMIGAMIGATVFTTIWGLTYLAWCVILLSMFIKKDKTDG
jgi:predicted MFS family arabinose efflux permease